jgi:hypothetical protein
VLIIAESILNLVVHNIFFGSMGICHAERHSYRLQLAHVRIAGNVESMRNETCVRILSDTHRPCLENHERKLSIVGHFRHETKALGHLVVELLDG